METSSLEVISTQLGVLIENANKTEARLQKIEDAFLLLVRVDTDNSHIKEAVTRLHNTLNDIEKDLETVKTDVNSIEKKFAWYSGAAFVIGVVATVVYEVGVKLL